MSVKANGAPHEFNYSNSTLRAPLCYFHKFHMQVEIRFIFLMLKKFNVKISEMYSQKQQKIPLGKEALHIQG